MLRYLIRRLLWAAVLFIAVTFVTYVIFFLVPANPARLAAGQWGLRYLQQFIELEGRAAASAVEIEVPSQIRDDQDAKKCGRRGSRPLQVAR